MNTTDSRRQGGTSQSSAEGQSEDDGECLWAGADNEFERNAELFMAALEENLRFTAELMDNIGQLVLLARIKLDMLSENSVSDGFAAVIVRVRELLDQAMAEIRTLLSKLTPPLLAELGLEYSLKHLCRQMEHDNGLQVRFDDDGSEKPLPDLARSIVYHAARETLFTVVHDTKTSAVQLSIGRVGAMLQLVVEDREGGDDCVETVLNHSTAGGDTALHCIRHLGGDIRFMALPGRRAGICIRVPLAVSQGAGSDGDERV